MKVRHARPTLAIRPAAVVTIVWVGLIAIWWLWILCVVRYPAIADWGTFRLIETPAFVALTVVDAALALALAADLMGARRGPRGLRAAHAAGALAGLALLVLVQYGAVVAWGPIPPGRFARPAPRVEATEVGPTPTRAPVERTER